MPVWRRGPTDLLPLQEATRRLRPFQQRYVGVRSIPLRQIVGSDGRAGDFDRDFRPRRRWLARRTRELERAFPTGAYPAVVAYRLGDAYFLVDGHHRVAAARRQGMEWLDAEVTELRARWPLSGRADACELVHAEHERLFATASGLCCLHPDARLRFTHAVGYAQLLEHVQAHGYRLMRCRGQVLDAGEVAADWLRTVYQPTVEEIARDGRAGICRGTDADRFLWEQERRRAEAAR